MSVLTALGAALHIPAPDCASPAEGPRPNHGLPCALLRGGITRPWQQHGQGQACTARQPAALGNARGAARFVCRRPASPVTAPRAASGDAPAEWCAFARPSGPYASGCWENARQARRHTHAARAQTRRACRGPQARAPPRAPPRPVRPRRAQRTVQYRASRARPAAPRPRAAAPPARTGVLSRRYRRHRRHRRSQQCAHPHPPARAASPSADPLDWVRTEEHSEQFGTPVFFLLCRTTIGSWTHICDASQSSSPAWRDGAGATRRRWYSWPRWPRPSVRSVGHPPGRRASASAACARAAEARGRGFRPAHCAGGTRAGPRRLAHHRGRPRAAPLRRA